MGKLKNYVAAGATAVLASTTSGQMALDKTVTNTSEQAYKTIVFANGDENTNPSYNFTGTNNINTGLSDARAGQPAWRRSNGAGGGTFVGSSSIGGNSNSTMAPEVVGTTTITWDQATALQKTVKTNTNSLGMNLTMTMKKSYADTNNDGGKDAFINEYSNLPTGADATAKGFLVGDIMIFSTPSIYKSVGGSSLLGPITSYKKLNNQLQREDSLDGPTGRAQENIIDRVTGPLATQEVNSITTTIYPNPTTDKIFVKLLNTSDKIDEYRLFSVTGQQVLTGKNLRSSDAIDVSRLPTGMYILQLKTQEGMKTHKVIKK